MDGEEPRSWARLLLSRALTLPTARRLVVLEAIALTATVLWAAAWAMVLTCVLALDPDVHDAAGAGDVGELP